VKFPVEFYSLLPEFKQAPPLKTTETLVGLPWQEIFFNEDAWRQVCEKGLWGPRTLNHLRNAAFSKPPSTKTVGAFANDPNPMVVKAFWLDVTTAQPWIRYVENYQSQPPGHDGCTALPCWRSKVEADLNVNKPCEAPASHNPTVSLNCFYKYSLGGQRARVLLGLHILTHEAADWVWSTFWGHPRSPAMSGPQQSPYALPAHDSHESKHLGVTTRWIRQ
jgi:hypothetical protein